MVRCPVCDAFVSEWAAACDRCGADVGDEPLIVTSVAASRSDLATPSRVASPFVRLSHGLLSPLARLWRERLRPRPDRRRGWRVGGPVGVVVVVLAGVVAWRITGGHPTRPVSGFANPTSFVPSVRQDGGMTLLPVTLLDGRVFELRYPSSLAVAQLGLTLSSEMRWPAGAAISRCCWTRVSASHATAVAAYGITAPLETYPGARGHPVWLFDAADRRLPPGFTGYQNLVFQFSGWLVEVDASAVGADGAPPDMSGQDRRMWAANLGASTSGGYVVLHPRGPLALAPASFVGRMSATFGLGRPNEPQGNTLDIEDGYCGQPESDTATRHLFRTGDGVLGVSWCDPATGLHLSAVGQAQFVTLVANELSLSASRTRVG